MLCVSFQRWLSVVCYEAFDCVQEVQSFAAEMDAIRLIEAFSEA